ncbi:MFS transporter [Mucilaginibacter calamicampi]|uniref:MFS transporter n=1 Tax=Mucilaginibacter calamicampi TaxID=1302352 RepID=A0ABW2Z0Q3_9SPHI
MATVSLSSAKGKWVMVATILASAMAFIDATALNVVLPALQQNLNASGADLFWVLNSYLLMLASLILIGGAMGDKLGRKRVFMGGIVLFIVGSAACGIASSITMLIICRAVQGIGGAFMIPGSLSLISSAINPNERGKAIGTWSAFTTVVTMGGPVLGGALADAGLWRYIFFINVPIGIAAFIMLAFRVDETRDTGGNKTLDFPGAITIALALALLTFGFLRIPAVGFAHFQAYGSLAGGLLFLIIFIVIEKRSKHPMMPLTLFGNPVFTGVNLLTFFLYAGLGAGMLFMSLNLVQVQGYSQLQSGLTFLPFTVLMVTIARYAGSLADKYGPKWFLIIGPAIAGAGLFLLSLIGKTNGPSDYWTTFFPGVFVLGLGMSLTVAPLTAAVMSSVSDHFSGTASGVNNAMTRISGVFANAIFGALAVLFFTSTLTKQIEQVSLSPQQKEQVIKQAGDLGDAKVPANIPSAQKKVIAAYYNDSFVNAYAGIMRISAGLGFLGSLMAMAFIRKKPK